MTEEEMVEDIIDPSLIYEKFYSIKELSLALSGTFIGTDGQKYVAASLYKDNLESLKMAYIEINSAVEKRRELLKGAS